MDFVLVPKGKSWLGGGGGTPGNKEVEIVNDIYLGKYEVTQEEWEKVTDGLNPAPFKAVAGIAKEDQKRFPVERVSWDDCQAFLERLNKQAKDAGWVYRLPTVVEWEYACRGGPMKDKLESGFDFYFEKPTNTLLPELANFDHANLEADLQGGQLPAEPAGSIRHARQRLGMVPRRSPRTPKDPKAAGHRVYRGGCWNRVAGQCKATSRLTYPPSRGSFGIGLRLGPSSRQQEDHSDHCPRQEIACRKKSPVAPLRHRRGSMSSISWSAFLCHLALRDGQFLRADQRSQNS